MDIDRDDVWLHNFNARFLLLKEAKLPALTAGVHRFIARSPSLLVAASLDDMLAESEQLNMPGTVREYPNWRRKYAVPVEDLAGQSLLRATVSALSEERGG